MRRWKAASAAKRPFCLAINQGPLNQLLLEPSRRIPQLEELAGQIETLLNYDTVPPTPKRVLAVDLNLRSVLTPDIIHHALQNLLKPQILDACPECFSDDTTDVALNRRALLHPQVKDRLVKLGWASYAGRHVRCATFKVPVMPLAGARCQMMKEPSNRDFRYFNRCFQGVGELFDAVRDVFEPERATVPVSTNMGEHRRPDGWLVERPPLTPDHLTDAWEQFTTLKRCHSEHQDGERLLALRRERRASLAAVIAGGAAGFERNLRPCSRLSISSSAERHDGMHLRLWGAPITTATRRGCRVVLPDFKGQAPCSCETAPWLTEAIDYALITFPFFTKEHHHVRLACASTMGSGAR